MDNPSKSPLFGVLEQTKLSRLPERKPFSLSAVPFPPQAKVCAACGTAINKRDEHPFEIGVCAKCLKIHVAVDDRLLENAKTKNRQWLEKAGGQK